jgi:hypothetical protein
MEELSYTLTKWKITYISEFIGLYHTACNIDCPRPGVRYQKDFEALALCYVNIIHKACKLNKILHRMKLTDSSGCEACGYCDEETVRHYLLECPAHERTRRKLRAKLGPQKAAELSYILREKKAMAPLFAYIDETGRFKSILGILTADEHNRVID